MVSLFLKTAPRRVQRSGGRHGGRGRVEDDSESDQGFARHDPAGGPVGRSLIWAEKGLEMHPRGHLSVTRRQGPNVATELWVNLWAGPYSKI